KDYFTIYDFVNAHHHFQDPEWDGEPLQPEPAKPPKTKSVCQVCGQDPCICEKPQPELCPVCGNDPCVCEMPPREMIKVRLSATKVIEFDSMVKTTFWSADGKPISHEQFLKQLYGDLPEFFKSEDELRKIWSIPGTRKKLMEELSEKGYSQGQLEDLRKIIHGEESDLFDVLSYVAYHRNMVPRLERASKARVQLNDYNKNQQDFLNFVLDQYIKVGVQELDESKLPDLLELKYNALADAKNQLGDIKSIRDTFIGFQKYLYKTRAI
ncbi:MAG: restriction endonuclease subunit R, partial [Flavobacteriaceae bacterium]|nr:restriction endonuclease subunit R [Flavobacteriaceae bacterium]